MLEITYEKRKTTMKYKYIRRNILNRLKKKKKYS